jgi:hypothetical protein
MSLSSKVAVPLIRGAVLVSFCAPSLLSQIRQIDSSKLPQDSAVQLAYKDLLPIDQFARTYEATWRFPVPKEDVASRFSAALLTLEKAQQQTPDNNELQLFTGLVARLAYNLGMEEAYDPALKLLQPLASQDYRAAWFLAMHQCQSNDPVGGMQRLLRVETSTSSLPSAFWQDYATCAGVTYMPVHAIRAYDLARKTSGGPPIDDQMEQIARNRIKPASITGPYGGKQVWYTANIGGRIRYTSTLCGEAFTTKPSAHVTFTDVLDGTCAVTIDTETYPSRYGPSSASLLLLTQIARSGESLEAFSQRMLKVFAQGKVKDPGHADKTPLAGIQCPVATCLSFEIVTDKLYKSEGSAHLLAVIFQSEQPAYPGLRLETPRPLPKVSKNSGDPTYFLPNETLQRFNGTLYTLVTLDANHDIYTRSRVDFDDLLKSLVVDSK